MHHGRGSPASNCSDQKFDYGRTLSAPISVRIPTALCVHHLSKLCRRCCRTEQAQVAVDKRMLLFWPWFVECAFQQHYNRTTLGFMDTICLPLDVLIWFSCVLAGWRTPVECLCSALPLMSSIAFAVYKYKQPDRYRRQRTVLTAFRRFLVMPYLSLVLLRRPLHVAGRWQSAFLHLFVLSGSVHTIIATFFFLNNWWTALFEIALAAVMLGAAAPTACSNVLAGPCPHAGWQAAAALMDKAALNIYSRSLQNASLEHAVCCSTLNTVLVRAAGGSFPRVSCKLNACGDMRDLHMTLLPQHRSCTSVWHCLYQITAIYPNTGAIETHVVQRTPLTSCAPWFVPAGDLFMPRGLLGALV